MGEPSGVQYSSLMTHRSLCTPPGLSFGRALLLAIGLLLGSDAKAQKVALVIGNMNYSAQRKLDNPHRDADAIGKVLIDKLGFRKEDVKIKKDLDFNSTIAELEIFQKQAIGKQIALIYYSGHGIAFNDANYMAPVDVPTNLVMHNDRNDPVIHLDEIQRTMSVASIGIVFWDACRSNSVTPKVASGARGPTSATRDLIPEAAPLFETNAIATFIPFSTNPRATADDGPRGQLSPFTKAVVNRLGERGRTFFQFMASVSDDVANATKNIGHIQKPEFRTPRLTAAGAAFYFVPPAPAPAPVKPVGPGPRPQPPGPTAKPSTGVRLDQ
jgi:uncharacterized caspase-like protein